MPDGAPTAEVAAVTAAYRLALAGARTHGRIGARRGLGPGSSLEFHDFRDYAPGDDLRHVDWRGYARTDQLRVRLHEAEVAPVVELLVDTSPSMAAHPAKRRALLGLARAVQGWTRAEGSAGRVLALGAATVDLDTAGADGERLAWDGPSRPAAPQLPLRAGSVRVLLTDGLWPDDPAPLLRRVAAGCSRFACVQLLDPAERDPEPAGAVTLVDGETGRRASLRLDAAAVNGYRERLRRLCEALREVVVGLGGTFASATAAPLPELCRRDLLPAGLVEPA